MKLHSRRPRRGCVEAKPSLWAAAALCAVFLPAGVHAQSNVGTIPGKFSVADSGAATYHMPMTLAPGPDGLTPELAIEYDSQAPDTFMGPGFSISGFSQISRCPQTVANDGAKQAVNFTEI